MDKESLLLKQLSASALREEREAEKLQVEIDNLRAASAPIPFYRSTDFIRPVITGLSIAIIFSAYFQYIFIPTQNHLIQKAETAEFQLSQTKAEHTANLARMELIREQLQLSSSENERKLRSAISSLTEAKKQNAQLTQAIKELGNKQASSKLADLSEQLKKSKTEIELKISDIEESRTKIDGLQKTTEMMNSPETTDGWIYIGYFPNHAWHYKTLELKDDEMPETEKTYTLIQNVNLREQPPKFTLFGYKFGKAHAVATPPHEVTIKEIQTVGFSKVWARVETEIYR